MLCNDARNLQNHRNGLLNFKDVADHWIGIPKSPYTSFTVTANPVTVSSTPPTSPPLSISKNVKKKKSKRKKVPSSKRRYDSDESPDYSDTNKQKQNFDFEDDFDYDYKGFDSAYSNSYSAAPYVISTSQSSPKAVMVKPAMKSFKAIYAGTPKIATYVIPKAKKYVVQKVKEAVYLPAVSAASPRIYRTSSNRGMKRQDPLDYDDNGGGSFSNLGPQDSFPPRPVLNKISQPGQSQPCHGPDCHQHHKGLVRFYWRRVIYPPGTRARGRLRRPARGRNRRRRIRGGARAPSDQKDIYFKDGDDKDDEDDTNSSNDNEDDDEDEDEEGQEDNDDDYTSRRNIWQPGKAYGHDFNEGSNYDDGDKRVYRDKRYVYRKRKRNRISRM